MYAACMLCVCSMYVVYMLNWASEASPTLGCSIEISRDIYIYMCVCQFVCLRMPKCVGGITRPKNAHAQFWTVKNDLRHPCYSFLLYGYATAALAWTKKKPKKNVQRSLRNKQRDLQRLKNRGKKG